MSRRTASGARVAIIAGNALRWMGSMKTSSRQGSRRDVRLGSVLAAVLSLVVSGSAHAFLDTGTLLTNAASATYMGGGQGTSVTYSATAKILVANPALFLWKDVNPTYLCTTGGTVTYKICFSNGGANTAFNVVIKDRLPLNSWALAGSGSAEWYQPIAGGYATIPAGNTAWSSNGGASWATGAALAPYGTNMGGGTGFYQWVVPDMGIQKSGCIIFLISIN